MKCLKIPQMLKMYNKRQMCRITKMCGYIRYILVTSYKLSFWLRLISTLSRMHITGNWDVLKGINVKHNLLKHTFFWSAIIELNKLDLKILIWEPLKSKYLILLETGRTALDVICVLEFLYRSYSFKKAKM